MPIQAANANIHVANVNIQTPSVRIHINESSAPQTTQSEIPMPAQVGLYAVGSGGAFSIAGLAIAGLHNIGPWAVIPCTVSEACRRLAEVTPAAVRCLTDAASLSRKLLCGGWVSEGNDPDPFQGCSAAERICLSDRIYPREGTNSTHALIITAAGLGVSSGIGLAVAAIITPRMRRANAQRQAQPETVEMAQSAGTVPTLHASEGPSAAVQERQAIASSNVDVVLISNPDGQVLVGLKVAESASRPLAA